MEERYPEEKEDAVYSDKVPAGRRMYFFDVKKTSKGDFYLVISERRRTEEGKKRDRIWVFQEDLERFLEALNRASDVVENSGELTS